MQPKKPEGSDEELRNFSRNDSDEDFQDLPIALDLPSNCIVCELHMCLYRKQLAISLPSHRMLRTCQHLLQAGAGLEMELDSLN